MTASKQKEEDNSNSIAQYFQPLRKDAFQIVTSIVLKKNSVIVTKSAPKPSGAKHLKSTVHSYKKLSEISLPDGFYLVEPSIHINRVDMKFIFGTSLETELRDAIISKDQKKSFNIIDDVIRFVESFPAKMVDPHTNENYNHVFGRNSYSGITKCIEPGLVDINLDNFIRDRSGDIAFIDYEWCFGFPVPKDYILGRFFYLLFASRLVGVLSGLRNSVDCFEIYPGLFVPEYIFKKYENHFEDIYDVIVAEQYFQRYVTGQETSEPAEVYKRSPNKSSTYNIPDPLKERLEELDSANRSLLSELSEIKKSRRYRYATKIANYKHKLKKLK